MKNHSPLVTLKRAGFKVCPRCGKPDNCSARLDRTAVFCRRVASDRPGTGGWLHILDDAAPPPTSRPTMKPKPLSVPRAERRLLNDIYTALRSLSRY
jgi:hypothetical protein